jgi:hypothetical protein
MIHKIILQTVLETSIGKISGTCGQPSRIVNCTESQYGGTWKLVVYRWRNDILNSINGTQYWHNIENLHLTVG